MNYTEREIALCRRLHELGVRPKIRIGDWVICYPSAPWLTCHEVEVAERNQNRNNYALLFSWERCREWLREKGWDWVRLEGDVNYGNGMKFTINKNYRMKIGRGQTDRECALAVMVAVEEGEI